MEEELDRFFAYDYDTENAKKQQNPVSMALFLVIVIGGFCVSLWLIMQAKSGGLVVFLSAFATAMLLSIIFSKRKVVCTTCHKQMVREGVDRRIGRDRLGNRREIYTAVLVSHPCKRYFATSRGSASDPLLRQRKQRRKLKEVREKNTG